MSNLKSNTDKKPRKSSARRYSFAHLTPAQLDALAEWYPDAVVTIRKPVYTQLAMLARCKAKLPDGVVLEIGDQTKNGLGCMIVQHLK